MAKARAYCYTLPNYSVDDYNKLKSVDCTYKIIGKEKCPTTGTLHLQCYFYWKNQKKFSSVKKILGNGHIEKANGTPIQNKAYCEKEGDYYEEGILPKQGARNDIKDCVETAKKFGIKQACIHHPSVMVKYHTGVKFVARQFVEKRNHVMEVIVLVGLSGTGKSRLAAELAGPDVYYKPRGEWWDDYDGQFAIIIDDFYGWLKYDEMLRLLDRYPHKVPIKGGFMEFNSKRIIITSNYEVQCWYTFPGYKENHAALSRRISTLHWLNVAGDYESAASILKPQYPVPAIRDDTDTTKVIV